MADRNSIPTRRVEWIDIARGIGIILVCIGHRIIPKGILNWIYSFHMPLFFFLSGTVTHFDNYSGLPDFLKRKTRTLLVPYVILGISFIVMQAVYHLIFRQEINLKGDFYKLVIGAGLGPSWFLIALLVTEIIAYVGWFFFCKKRCLPTLLIFGAGFYINSYMTHQLLWNINTAMIGLLYFEMGIFVRKHMRNYSMIELIKISLICLTLNIVSVIFNGRVDLIHRQLGNVFLFLAGSLNGIGFIVMISIIIEYTLTSNWIKKILLFYGRNTMLILFFHIFPGYVISETLQYRLLGVAYTQNTALYCIEGFAHAFFVLIMFIPIIVFVNVFAPWAVGKKNPVEFRKS